LRNIVGRERLGVDSVDVSRPKPAAAAAAAKKIKLVLDVDPVHQSRKSQLRLLLDSQRRPLVHAETRVIDIQQHPSGIGLAVRGQQQIAARHCGPLPRSSRPVLVPGHAHHRAINTQCNHLGQNGLHRISSHRWNPRLLS
jgi:hypothetical protein